MEKKYKKKKTVFNKFLVGRNILTFLFIISIIILILIYTITNSDVSNTINIYVRNPIMFYIICFPFIQIYAPCLHINQSTIIFILLVGLSLSVMFSPIFDIMWGFIKNIIIFIKTTYMSAPEILEAVTIVSDTEEKDNGEKVVIDNPPGGGLFDLFDARAVATGLGLETRTMAGNDKISPVNNNSAEISPNHLEDFLEASKYEMGGGNK